VKAYEVFYRAGDILRKRGWHKGWFSNTNGNVCAQGACNAAVDGEPGSHSAGVRPDLNCLIRAATGYEFGLPSWNDAPSRTQAEVEVALDAAFILALQEDGIEPEDVL
jgi:hypothetical protein